MPSIQTMTPGYSGSIPKTVNTQAETLTSFLPDFELFKISPEGRDLVRWIKTQFDACKSDRLIYQRQWDMNLEMYSGRQWLEYMGTDASNLRLVQPNLPRHRVRATTNLIRPLVRMEIARLTSQQPTAYVVPMNSNQSSIAAANGGEMVWKSIVERIDFQTNVMHDVAFWTVITGNGIIKGVWDSRAQPSGVESKLPDGTTVQATGDNDIGSLKPYNLFVPDLLPPSIEDQPYTFEAYVKPIEWVKRYFGPLLSEGLVPDTEARNELYQARYFGTSNNTSAVPESVLIIECYIKPGGCKYFPEGGMVTLVGNELAQVSQQFPFSDGEFPYGHVKDIPTGRFYGDSVLIDINPLQREYNGTRSQIIENKRKLGNPPLLVPKGSMRVEKVTGEPGAMYEYLPGLGKPEPMQYAPVADYVREELAIIKNDMDDISGQHGPSRGTAPGMGVTAATAIAFLQEKDDNLITPTTDSVEAAIQKTARHVLRDVKENWDLPRLVKASSIDGIVDAIELKGSEISTDIKIETGSSLPESRPARQAFLMEMAQNQFITPDQLLDLLDFGGVKKLTDQIRIDVNQARRENLRIKNMDPSQIDQYNMQKAFEEQTGTQEQAPNGAPAYMDQNPQNFPPMVDVHTYDNHKVHIETHNNWRKTAEFEALAQVAQDEMDRHVRMHQAFLDSNMQQLQQAQMGGQAPPSGMPMPDGSNQPPPVTGGGPDTQGAPPDQGSGGPPQSGGG